MITALEIVGGLMLTGTLVTALASSPRLSSGG